MPAPWTVELRSALAFLQKGQPQSCLDALETLLLEHGDDELCRALIHDGRGRALFTSGQPEAGLVAFRESSNLLEKLYAEKRISPEFMQGTLQNQAHARLMLNDFDEAIELGRMALQLAEQSAGSDSSQAAQALFHLSAPYYQKKDYDTAEKLLRQAMQIWEGMPGPVEQIGTCLNNLGRIYEERGQLVRGIDYHRRAVEFRRALPNREDLAFSLGNYGVALGSDGQLAKACDAMRECIATYAAIGRGNSPEAKAFEANLSLFEEALRESGEDSL